MKVSIIGQGYVGLPLAMAATSAGWNVIGIDVNKKTVANLNIGKIKSRWNRHQHSSLDHPKIKHPHHLQSLHSQQFAAILIGKFPRQH